MHALTIPEGTTCAVSFGGSCIEHWTDRYELSVTYQDERRVNAVRKDGRWVPEDGDREIRNKLLASGKDSILQRYFSASADACAAVRECLRRRIPVERLYEIFSFDEPFAAQELMRLLMDEQGLRLERAFRVTALASKSLALTEEETAALDGLQPRTAKVAGLLREMDETTPLVEHDGRNRLFRDPPCAIRCGEPVRISFRVLRGTADRAFFVLYGDRGRTETEMTREGNVFTVSFSAPVKAEALWYLVRIESGEKELFLCPDETGYTGELFRSEKDGFRFTVYRDDYETPEWFRGTVMYQAFPDRFAFSDDGTARDGIAYHLSLGQHSELHGSLDEPPRWRPRPFETSYMPDDFYGGTLKGIENAVPYLKELGVGCLYLNPVTEANSNHRYDTSDYMKIDPILGTNEDFEHLCETAARAGIRVILDGVFSHTGADSIYFDRSGHYGTSGACRGKDSPYYSWYDFRHFPNDYRCWWGFQELPEVNEEDPAWQAFVVSGEDSVVRTWLRRGASGWRLDVADELPDDVLRLIRLSAKEEKPDAPIIGEVWEDAVVKQSYGGRRNYALGYSLDSVMNYPFRKAVLDFAHNRIDARALRDFLIAQRMNYPRPMYESLMNLLGSHDVERLKTALATDTVVKSLPREEQLKLTFTKEALEKAVRLERICAALQFSLPGVPSIYYGDEQGMEGVGDPFNRRPFRRGDEDLHKYYVNLSKLRGSDPVFSRGEVFFAAPSADILTVTRYFQQGTDGLQSVFVTVINRGEEDVFSVDLSFAGLEPFEGMIGACSARIDRVR